MYHTTPVREFHDAFGHPVQYGPVVPTLEHRLLRVKLIAEELTELAQASGVSLNICPNGKDYRVDVNEAPNVTVDLVECADALGDLRYVVDGSNLVYGFPGEAVLAEIHRSNMSKLDADGKPIYREDGKVMKGPDYTPPDIASVLRKVAA